MWILSRGYTLHDLLVDFAKSKSPVANHGDFSRGQHLLWPLPADFLALGHLPTLDDFDHQPAPSPEPDINGEMGAPLQDVPHDQPGTNPDPSFDGPMRPPLVHLPPAVPQDPGPGLDDPVQPLPICALPAKPPDDHTDEEEPLTSDNEDSFTEASYSDMPPLEVMGLVPG